MTLSDLPSAFREALAYHWIVGAAFKIATSDLYAAYYTDQRRLQVLVRHRGLEFHIDVAEIDFTREDFERAWPEAVEVYNAASTEEKTVMIESTYAREHAVNLVAAMVAKGFKLEKALAS